MTVGSSLLGHSKHQLKVHVFQHEPFEDIGLIHRWIDERGYILSYTRFFEPHQLPQIDTIDVLVVMGGPMSVHDEVQLSWLVDEKHLIAQAIAADKVVVGICLGGQLIAHVLGAAVQRAPCPEIGWFSISCQTDHHQLPLPAAARVFHWHGETFDIPQGGTHLASSEACRNQMFMMGDRVLAMQFHLEMTDIGVDDLIHNCTNELLPNEPYIQQIEQLQQFDSKLIEHNGQLLAQILDHLVQAAYGGD